ncbi:GNAT family N-acetyltransferase [Streptomyces sp. NBC_00247]|uniref:GNAT family N-acetyltransferase n=1 Tax=Streptomyces sp. NBC_00247 TaxID=2975689 RepID=UPI002E2A0581|nr:GNAT family N-acetyltransferase [Streptomyces sp. NBC_00247]
MSELHVHAVSDDLLAEEWRSVHNLIVPTAPLTADEVRERRTRNLLFVARAAGVVAGCSTVRPPTVGEGVATVIARILPECRKRGFGTALYAHGLALARESGARTIETVVLGSNTEGLEFARARGFVEVETYLLPGDTIPFVDLRLAESPAGGPAS